MRQLISFLGDMNGQGFNIGVDPSTFEPDDTYDAILFTFDNAEGTTPVWEMSANMSMTTPYPGLSGDDFQANIYGIQNFEVVPEPGTFGLDVAVVDNGFSSATNGVVLEGGNTNITHTADAYYYVAHSVHVFGAQITTNTYGPGSNVVVETITNVQTNGTITPSFAPYVTSNDQIPYWWLAQHYGHTNDFDSLEGTDTDDDGLDALGEYVSGTNPTNTQSALAFQAVSGMAMQVHSVPGRNYTLWRSASLLPPDWAAFTNQPGTGGIIEFTDPAPVDPATFYRLSVELAQ